MPVFRSRTFLRAVPLLLLPVLAGSGLSSQPVQDYGKAIQAVQAYRPAAAGSVHEAALADVDAHVADLAAAAEEHQVATGQALALQPWPLHLGQFARAARQAQVEHVAVDVVDQAAAVEARIGGVAPIAVGRADQAQGAQGDRIGPDRVGRYHLRPVASGGRGGGTGGLAPAAGQQCGGGQQQDRTAAEDGHPAWRWHGRERGGIMGVCPHGGHHGCPSRGRQAAHPLPPPAAIPSCA